MLLSELFDNDVVTVSPSASVFEVARKMKDENVGAVVVTDDDHKVVGIVTDRDVALAVALGEASSGSPVTDVMTVDVKTIWDDQGVFYATQYFAGHHIRRLPIIDRQDRLVGMMTTDDLFGLFAREMFNVAQALEPALGEHV
jgi:CBS domain-containing protein